MSKRFFAIVIPFLFVSIACLSNQVTAQEPKVEVNFAWLDWGIGIIVWNAESESIYNVTIDFIESYGAIIVGSTIGGRQAELESAEMRCFVTPVIGFGKYVATVGVSYEYDGKTYSKILYGFLLVIGGITIVLNEW